jgi:hypothetical protein
MGEWGWKSFDTLTGAEAEDLAAGIERRLIAEEPAISRVDVVPVGEAPPAGGDGTDASPDVVP